MLIVRVIFLVASTLLAGCTQTPSAERDKAILSQCEDHIKSGLVSPSSFQRVSVTIGIPDETKKSQNVFVSYDSSNSYGVSVRGIEQCVFPYGEEEAKIRPVTSIERKVVAESRKENSEDNIYNEENIYSCCMPQVAVIKPTKIDSKPLDLPSPRIEPETNNLSSEYEHERAGEDVDLCFQDYCPCDSPQGGPDKGICRQLKAGINVDPEMMSAAAMMRDARQQLEDWKQENGDF